ncbi:plexin-B3-like [Anarrhichthys ocellatus]|uniref:plexin-B3-like n=1 Tax=Anarrhichthys ocellatus TaxID=433405 RepID=UPI0012EE7281|nr:plexin-B3-like [Anarrhichthys ocellatus]XP_031698551.1 plexin-B3-like [Anarrhichthys ocellatus]
MVTGKNLGVVQQPIISVWVEPLEVQRVKRRRRLALLTAKQLVFNSTMRTVSEPCSVLSSSQMTCPTPKVTPEVKVKGVWFQLDNVRVHYETIKVPVCLSACLSVRMNIWRWWRTKRSPW